MNNKIEKQYTVPFLNGQEEERQKVLNQMYKIAVESIRGDLTNETIELFLSISNNFERLSNALNTSEPKNKAVFDYGFLFGIVNLVNDIQKKSSNDLETLVFIKRYKLLFPVISFIFKNRKVTGKQIKEELNFKNDSNLTNFISRINQYNLLYIQKIGTTNYYSLTKKGKDVYWILTKKEKNEKEIENNIINESVLLSILDSITKQMASSEPNITEIIKIIIKERVQIENKAIFKAKINNIFVARDKYTKNIFNQHFQTQHIKIITDYAYLGESSEKYDSYNDEFFECIQS